MDSIGDTLRCERLRRGLTLEQLAAQTKIGLYYLQAMEENRFDRLPGGLFTRSFVRQYTNALDLNEEEIITWLKQQFEEPPVPLPEPQSQRRPVHLPHVPAFVWLVMTISLCGGVFGYWEHQRRSFQDAGTLVQQQTPHGSGAGLNRRPPVVTPAKPLETGPRSVEEPAIRRSAASETGQGTGAAALHVVLAATEPVWVSIKSDGINAYSGTLDKQEKREFEATTKMSVLVGNVGGVAISMNGRPIALRGTHGEVQSLVLTPAGAQVVPRATPSRLSTTPEHGDPPDESQPVAEPSDIVHRPM